MATSLADVIGAFAPSGITILTDGAALTAIAAAAAVEQIERGGVLLWVTVNDREEERRAIEILKRHSATELHVHDSPTRSG